jgi:hypothetical protein
VSIQEGAPSVAGTPPCLHTMPGAVMRSAFRKKPKKEDAQGDGKRYQSNDAFRAVGADGEERAPKSAGFYRQMEEKKKKTKQKEKAASRKAKAESAEDRRRRKAQDLAQRIERRRSSAHLSGLEGLEQRKKSSAWTCCRNNKKKPPPAADAEAGQVAPPRPLPRPGPTATVTVASSATVVPEQPPVFSRPKPTLTRRSSSFSPDDEPEDFVVTEIQRIARGKFQRKSIVEAKLTAADELQRLKTEYDAKLAALKKQHEEEMRKVYAVIREEHRARSPTRGTGRGF